MDKAIRILIETEKLAQDILGDKHEIISLSKRQNDNRVALREIEKIKDKSEKVWITIGSLLTKTAIQNATKLLENGKYMLLEVIKDI